MTRKLSDRILDNILSTTKTSQSKRNTIARNTNFNHIKPSTFNFTSKKKKNDLL